MPSESYHSDPDATATKRQGYWRTLLNDLSGAPRFAAPGLFVFWLLPLIVGILVTIVLVVGNYDLLLQQAIYKAGGNSWALGEHPVWRFLYHVGPFPAIILGVLALVCASLSWSLARFGKWRRVYIYIVLLLFWGPAVIVNFGLKDNWGRPRPIHVDSMGGKQPFENVFVWNESREGKSFPCGHASTGYILMAGFFVFFRHRRRLAYGWLIFGGVFGTLLGIARMLQGGHFLTDVIWVALICYYLAFWFYYLLGLKDSVSREVKRRHKMPVKVRLAIGFVVVLSLIAILLATPYRDDRNFVLDESLSEEMPIHFGATFTTGRVEIVPSDRFRIHKKSSGHGVPTSKVASTFSEQVAGEFISAHYFERLSGWFHELETEATVELPWNQIESMQVESASAEISIEPGALENRVPLTIGPGAGTITIQPGGNAVAWGGGNKDRLQGAELLKSEAEVQKGLILHVSDEFSGSIRMVE